MTGTVCAGRLRHSHTEVGFANAFPNLPACLFGTELFIVGAAGVRQQLGLETDH